MNMRVWMALTLLPISVALVIFAARDGRFTWWERLGLTCLALAIAVSVMTPSPSPSARGGELFDLAVVARLLFWVFLLTFVVSLGRLALQRARKSPQG